MLKYNIISKWAVLYKEKEKKYSLNVQYIRLN